MPRVNGASVGSRRERQRGNTLGRVGELAAYVRPDWWRHVFNALYLKTDGDVLDDPATRREVDSVLAVLPLQKSDRILDLCCGQGRHALELARRGFGAVEGLDQSRYLMNRARGTAKREELPVTFHQGDARVLSGLKGGFDSVLIMGNSFGYFLSAEDDLAVMREVRQAMRDGGSVFLDVTDGEVLRERFEPRSWEWLEKGLFVCREREISPDGRMVSREVITDAARGVVRDQFYAERLYNREQLGDLLERAGFDDFTVHEQILGMSERNQDLGMMAHRLLISAIAGGAGRARLAPRHRPLVVLLGDPGQPDAVKPGGQFGQGDLDAVARMKRALGEKAGRRVRYLSNHEQLLGELAGLKGQDALVVNFCDEGLRNQPALELHVPVLLDALELKYTGAGPQCLARCFDKGLVRGLARELGIPVAPGVVLGPGEPLPEITRPVIVKPNQADGGFGIDTRSIAGDARELEAAIAAVRELVGPEALLLIEELLTGKEIGVGLVGNGSDLRVLPLVEEDYSSLPPGLPRICGYRAKWDPSSPYWQLKSIPVVLPEETRRVITEGSKRLFARLECRDYARIDWRLDEQGAPHLLEVNPNPGWCWDGHLAKMAALEGLSYAGLLEAVIHAAERRR